MSEYRAALSALGLTLRQAELLQVVADHPGEGVQFAATQIEADLPTVSALVARLEERGLLERANDPDDRRRSRLFVTEEARQLLARIARARAFADDRIRTAAGRDADRAARLLTRLAARLQPPDRE